MLSKTKSAAPTLRGRAKRPRPKRWSAPSNSRRTRRRATSSSRPAPTLSRSPPSVAEAGIRHLRKKLQAADKNYGVALLSCGVADDVVARRRRRRKPWARATAARSSWPSCSSRPATGGRRSSRRRAPAHRDLAADVRVESRLTVLRHRGRRTRGLQAPERRGAE